jgi:hypothetical protein
MYTSLQSLAAGLVGSLHATLLPALPIYNEIGKSCMTVCTAPLYPYLASLTELVDKEAAYHWYCDCPDLTTPSLINNPSTVTTKPLNQKSSLLQPLLTSWCDCKCKGNMPTQSTQPSQKLCRAKTLQDHKAQTNAAHSQLGRTVWAHLPANPTLSESLAQGT